MKTKLILPLFVSIICLQINLLANTYFNENTPLLTKLLCSRQAEDFNDELYNYWLKDTPTPNSHLLKFEMLNLFEQLPPDETQFMMNKLASHFEFLTEEIVVNSSSQSNYDKLKTLTALEVGDNSSPEMVDLQQKWEKYKTDLAKLYKKYSHLCEPYYKIPSDQSSPPENLINSPIPPRGLTQAIWGLRVLFATAYQSCKVLDLPAIDKSTPNLEGIAIVGKHKDGVGNKRTYKNVTKIFTTHNYYKNILPLEKACYLPAKQPLIYDYGGKPATTTDANSKIDLFTNQGSGTEVLGIDCSGFVFSAIARAGLRLAPNKNLKAILVNGVSAAMFKDPQKNGLGCFYPITVSSKQTLIGGEVAAIKGHVVMLDEVSSDPFGIKAIKKLADCNSKNITFENFKFSILQSSTYKNALGIGKAKAADYLRESATMRAGFEKYAVASCQAQFENPKTPRPTELTVSRNSNTPECINESYVALTKESCVTECRYN